MHLFFLVKAQTKSMKGIHDIVMTSTSSRVYLAPKLYVYCRNRQWNPIKNQQTKVILAIVQTNQLFDQHFNLPKHTVGNLQLSM